VLSGLFMKRHHPTVTLQANMAGLIRSWQRLSVLPRALNGGSIAPALTRSHSTVAYASAVAVRSQN